MLRHMQFCTGGTAGLGLLTASYMLEFGAATLILLGRTGRCANAADMRMLADEGCRACVTLLRADVSGQSEAQNTVTTAHCAPVRLGGVLHAAGLQARNLPLPRECLCLLFSMAFPLKLTP